MNRWCRRLTRKAVVFAAGISFMVGLLGEIAAAQTRAQNAPPLSKPLDANNLEQLRAHRGETVTVEGRIERQGESKNGTVRFLDFKKDYREGFVLVFFTWKGEGKFTKEKLAGYLGKKVRATGKLTEYGSTMQIEVESLDQLKIIPSRGS
ncbi:MAG TPA: hypothetical protein VFV83_08085 [Chthoniobacteraceae bacterium]|nr:hypothetical protein [Chthoniobacteraceae bacterium]